MTDGRLEQVPEDWQRALAIAAHPDDLEYRPSSAIARWTATGEQADLPPGEARPPCAFDLRR